MHCLERRSKSLKYTQDDVCMINDDEGLRLLSKAHVSGNDHKVLNQRISSYTLKPGSLSEREPK